MRIYGLSCLIFFQISICAAQPIEIKQNKPNIIYINVDDLGWMDTDVYGSSFYQTPNITRLANMGMRFTNSYAAAANCAPSRACLISGQNTPRHGIYTVGTSERGNIKTRKIIPVANTEILADSVFTLPEMFKQAGYTTASIGKWHLGNDARSQGFDVNVGGGKNGSPMAGGYFSPYGLPFLNDGPKGEELTTRLTNEALHFIKTNKDKPFFVYLPFYAVHTPLQTFDSLQLKYQQKTGVKSKQQAIYAGMVETVDFNVGKILDALAAWKLENTIIVFTSDNGGIRKISEQDPLRAGKGSYYEGGIRVPCIVKWTGVVKQASIATTPITNLDFFPTFMEIVGQELPNKTLDGNSILPVLKGKNIKQRALYFHFPIYLEAYSGVGDASRDPLFRTRPGSVIIEGKWKLHQYFEDGALELYNLTKDVCESKNLYAKKNTKAKALLNKLITWRTQIGATIPTTLNPSYDASFEASKIEEAKAQGSTRLK